MNTTAPGVSVIVCCYNSVKRLPETVKHLAQQIVPDDINWEVIIVNNASSDHTYETAVSELRRYETLVNRAKVLNESKPGLSFARELGITTAKYAYIIFCDDDNWLASNYVALSHKIMSENHTIGALGGESDAATDADQFPDWFENAKGSFAVGKQQSYDGFTNRNLWGAGMIIRKELYKKCFPPEYPSYLTGRNGSKLSAGEDTEYCLRLQLKNYRLYYDSRLKFTHFISQSRLSQTYYANLGIGFNEAITQLFDQIQLVLWKNASFFGKLTIVFK
ncbi:MAG: glycosyltransferase, partial [Bacteroidia bacterium]